MPNTITSVDFKTFQPNTKIKSAEVNSNFDMVRGDLIPIEEDTSASLDLVRSIGDADHRWKRSYHHFGNTTLSSNFSVTSSFCNSFTMISAAGDSVTATLPTASAHAGMMLGFKVSDISNSIQIASDGGNIEGTSAAYSLSFLNQTVSFLSDGSNWRAFGAGSDIDGTDNFVPLFNGANGLDASIISQAEIELLNGRTYIPNAVGSDNKVALFNGTNNIDAAATTQTEVELLSGMASVSTGVADNDKIPTKGYVDDAISGVAAGSLLVSTKSADYTITDTDNITTVLVDDTSSPRTITLPTVADNTSRFITIKNDSSDGGIITVDGEGAETIGGETTIVLSATDESISVQSNGTEWKIIEKSQHTVVVKDEKASGTNGQTLTASTWVQRLNLAITSGNAAIVGVSSSVMTLQKGKYSIETESMAYKTDAHMSRFRNTTDGTTALTSSSNYAAAAYNVGNSVTIKGIIDIDSAKNFELQHWAGTTGLGGVGVTSGEVETFSTIKITKLR